MSDILDSRFATHGLPLPHKVKLIPLKYLVDFAFVLRLIGTDDLLHSCSHDDRYFTPICFFAFAFVSQNVLDSDNICFCFA